MMIGDTTTSTTTSTRRPSQARIRKSISEDMVATVNKMNVTWCPTTTEDSTNVIEVSNHYDGIDKETIWYSREELRMIRISNEITIAEYHNNNNTEQSCCKRGLEAWTEEGYWNRYQQVRDCINKVLDEQDRQKGIDRTHLGIVGLGPSPLVKRVNHLHIPFDHERLAALCRDTTAKSRRTALKKAKKDATAVRELQQQEQDHQPEQEQDQPEQDETPQQEQEKQLEEILVKEKPTADDNDSNEETMTVQTEASTIMISSADGEAEDDSEVSITENDEEDQHEEVSIAAVPLEISHPATAESLAEKQRLRYQAYLLNRQARMIAKEQAEYQWEQRRMERRSSTKLYQDNLDCLVQFKQLQKHRVQCMSLMATVTM